MKLLINGFPREVRNPFPKLFFNKHEFFDCINKQNGKKNLYFSLYIPNAPMELQKFTNPVIDVIFFDFDSKDNLNNMIKAHKALTKLNLKHLLVFSGRNFQLYVFTLPQQLNNSKVALFNAHNYLAEEMQLTWGDEKVCDLDHHIRGNVNMGGRMLNTVNLKTKLYCIPLTITDLNKGIDYIRKLAKKQRFEYRVYGSNLFNIESFDNEVSINKVDEDIDFEDSIIKIEDLVKDFFPCVKEWLLKPHKAKLRHRYFFALYCKCSNISRNDCDKIAKFYWSGTKDSSGSKTKYKEFVEERQVKCAYEADSSYPSCWRLQKEGSCPERCKFEGIWSISST